MSLSNRSGRALHWAEAFGLSALVHVGAVVFVLDFVSDLQLFAPPQEDPPDLLVTSLILDAETLAAATQDVSAGANGAEDQTGEVPDPVEEAEVPEPESLSAVEEEPETPEPAAPEPEQPDPVEPDPEPELPPEPEAEEPDPVELEPETPDSVEPESLTPEAVEPETELADAVGADDETLQPVSPEPSPEPEPLSPLRPDEDELALLAPVGAATPERLTGSAPAAAPEALAPIAPSTPVTVAPTMEAASPERIAPRTTRPQVSPPAPRRPAAPPPAPGSPAAVVSELIAKIRARVADPCLVAMPRQRADGSPELVMLAADEGSITDFATAVLAEIDPRPGQRGELVDNRQCPALAYVRENPAYPAFRLTLGLATDSISSGEELQGAVGRYAGRYVSLLLVDDNGVVQDVGSYLTFSGDQARFSIPMRRDGNPRDTQQVLIAVATDARPATLDQSNGQLAEDFFPALQAEIGTEVPLVMIPFDVR